MQCRAAHSQRNRCCGGSEKHETRMATWPILDTHCTIVVHVIDHAFQLATGAAPLPRLAMYVRLMSCKRHGGTVDNRIQPIPSRPHCNKSKHVHAGHSYQWYFVSSVDYVTLAKFRACFLVCTSKQLIDGWWNVFSTSRSLLLPVHGYSCMICFISASALPKPSNHYRLRTHPDHEPNHSIQPSTQGEAAAQARGSGHNHTSRQRMMD